MNKPALLLALTLLACNDDDSCSTVGAVRSDGLCECPMRTTFVRGGKYGACVATNESGDAGTTRDAATGPDAHTVTSADAATFPRDAATDAGGDVFTDAAAPVDASVSDAAGDDRGDGSTDAGFDAGSCETVLLVGGQELTSQGWTAVSQAPSALTYGADYTRIETTTQSGARTSGQYLLYRTGLTVPFKIEVVLLVESVSAHNPLDSAAALLGSFAPTFGNSQDRMQMVAIDSASVGWADDRQSAAFNAVDGQYHSYVLSVDAQNVAHLSVDGVEKLTRNGFITNGNIALGDQTNDPNVDAVLRIKSITQLCP